MQLVYESPNLDDYLKELPEVDFTHPLIQQKAHQVYLDSNHNQVEYIKNAYEFVRDEIPHSWDIQSTRVTQKASEVLQEGEGICYAKSNLLAALLRAKGIAVGFCYQRLMLFDTPEKGYSIHALNAVYIESENKWIRLDARGNKPGVQAEFSLDKEKLAFPIHPELDEVDYPVIYSMPNEKTMKVLSEHTDCLDMYLNFLPERIG
ncbi:transglutaminase-like domain-containing protein [Ectobacillus panaciterrae]|uniref:transglutaminase-like domain-containing protein n=1 Tax=Ectobacillus panaciterrae TaxID=363872 RepID=UPI00040BAB01|nr:transglutaminase family protein [Ectobacillus panaciterrae]